MTRPDRGDETLDELYSIGLVAPGRRPGAIRRRLPGRSSRRLAGRAARRPPGGSMAPLAKRPPQAGARLPGRESLAGRRPRGDPEADPGGVPGAARPRRGPGARPYIADVPRPGRGDPLPVRGGPLADDARPGRPCDGDDRGLPRRRPRGSAGDDATDDGSRPAPAPASTLSVDRRLPLAEADFELGATAGLGRDGRGLRGGPEEPAQAGGAEADPAARPSTRRRGCGGSSPRPGRWPGCGTRTSSACTASAGWPTAAISW